MFLWLALLLSSLFALWTWFRPFQWNADPEARFRVVGVHVARDQSYYWVTAHLKVTPGKTHDMQKPVYLLTAGGDRIEPADTTFGGTEGTGTTEIWLKFWLEARQVSDPLRLRLNDGTLSLKAKPGVPEMNEFQSKHFTSHHW